VFAGAAQRGDVDGRPLRNRRCSPRCWSDMRRIATMITWLLLAQAVVASPVDCWDEQTIASLTKSSEIVVVGEVRDSKFVGCISDDGNLGECPEIVWANGPLRLWPTPI
jgi:hypothetical protein